MHPKHPVCTPPATLGAASAVAAPAVPVLEVGSDMLRGELSHPIGFWVTCHGMLAFLPSDAVRQERRA